MGRRRDEGHANTKKTKEDKIKQGNEIREQLKQYKRIYVINFTSSSSEPFNNIRRRFRSSVLCNAKKSIIEHAIGTTPETEVLPSLSQIIPYITGTTALFMTNEEHETVTSFLESLTAPDFANAGFIATTTFTVPQGELDSTMFSYSMDGYLRELGLPVTLDNGKLINIRDYTVCTEGEPLTKNSAQLLRQFGQKIATFQAIPLIFWQDGKVFKPNE